MRERERERAGDGNGSTGGQIGEAEEQIEEGRWSRNKRGQVGYRSYSCEVADQLGRRRRTKGMGSNNNYVELRPKSLNYPILGVL